MATTTGFDDNDKFLLIDCVKAQPAIWDITLKDYKNKDKSAQWKNVVQDMEDATGREFKVDDAKAQWEALRRQFSNTKKRKRTGDGAEAGNPPVWRFWMPMLFIECADVSVERISSVEVAEVQQEVLNVDGDTNEDEETKENKVPTPKNTNAKRKMAESTPNTSKKSKNIDPELELIGSFLGEAKKEIDPHASMVNQMIKRLAKHRRAQFDFKNAIGNVIREFEGWLIDQEEGTEIGEEVDGMGGNIGAEFDV